MEVIPINQGIEILVKMFLKEPLSSLPGLSKKIISGDYAFAVMKVSYGDKGNYPVLVVDLENRMEDILDYDKHFFDLSMELFDKYLAFNLSDYFEEPNGNIH